MQAGSGAPAGIVGRGDELAAIASIAGDAAAGRAWVAWIEGEAGSGKTALLRAALGALPEGFTVLAAEADELAGDIPFHLAHQLGAATATAAFPVGLELLEVWSEAEEAGPAAVVVEDLHWADSESRLALLSAVRRLAHDRILVLVTSRPAPVVTDGWERMRFDPDRCLGVALGPLSPPEVAEMAERSGVRLSFQAAERLCRHAGGHPLYVRTLLSELPPEQLAAADGELPAPRSLALATVARLGALPPDARSLAAALAVMNQRIPLPVAAAVAGIGQPARTLDDLLGTGFVTWQPEGQLPSLQYAHPLYRAAVYADLAPTLRQELHRRAADLVGGEAALAHRVAAADSADDALSDQAEDAARAEAARQRLALAARYLLWASELSSRPAAAQTRLLRAARLLLTAEHTGKVAELRPRIEACAPSALRSLVLGVLARHHGDVTAAERMLIEAAGLAGAAQVRNDSADGTDVEADALAELAFLYASGLQPRKAVAAAERALALRPEREVERTALASTVFGTALSRGAQAGLDRLAKRLPERAQDVTAADVDLLIIRGSLGFWAGRLTAAIGDLRWALRLARHGPALLLPVAHLRLSQLLFEAGDWDEALVHAHLVLSLVPDRGATWVEAETHSAIACVLAARGEWAEAEEHLAAAQAVADERDFPDEIKAIVRITQAVSARARGEPAGVIAAIGPMLGLGDRERPEAARFREVRLRGLGILWWPLLIEALLDTGDTEAAARQFADLQGIVAEFHLGFAFPLAAVRARLSAEAGQPDQAVAQFRQAAGLAGPDDLLLDRALLLHHAFGRLLHARGDRRGAVDQLRAAHRLLTGVGATPFVARVEADLAAAGMPVAASQRKGSPLALTGREADVVALVAKGMTNTEVAAELYVSTNTVEYHLRNVFAKLGISSRRELRKFAG
jgi:DNA-binding CsgD family transcriptional regulator/tetratricopeptide (TPR) repeat protein